MRAQKIRIDALFVDEVAAILVYLLKREVEAGELEPQGAKGNILTCHCADGSTVRVALSKKPRDEDCREYVKINGKRPPRATQRQGTDGKGGNG